MEIGTQWKTVKIATNKFAVCIVFDWVPNTLYVYICSIIVEIPHLHIPLIKLVQLGNFDENSDHVSSVAWTRRNFELNAFFPGVKNCAKQEPLFS